MVYQNDCKAKAATGAGECLRERGHAGPHSWQAKNYHPSFFDMVAEFHKTGKVEAPSTPTFEKPHAMALTVDLIEEEFAELLNAYKVGDMIEFADAIADLTVVVLRAGYMAGIPMNEVFAEVHRSNMTKYPDGKVLYRADGKILKPESWEAPRIKEIIDGAEKRG